MTPHSKQQKHLDFYILYRYTRHVLTDKPHLYLTLYNLQIIIIFVITTQLIISVDNIF
jgi:hypothetical protein